jgi:hypothetical protein
MSLCGSPRLKDAVLRGFAAPRGSSNGHPPSFKSLSGIQTPSQNSVAQQKGGFSLDFLSPHNRCEIDYRVRGI